MNCDQNSLHEPGPTELHQAFLDATSQAVLAGHLDLYCTHFALPYVVVHVDGETVVETPEELIKYAEMLYAVGQQNLVSDYIRVSHGARRLDETTIEGQHVSYILSKARLVADPFRSRILLTLSDGRWLCTRTEHEMRAKAYPLTLLASEPGHFERVQTETSPASGRSSVDADAQHKAFLASLDAANHSGDFEAWCAHFVFPTIVHLPDANRVFRDPSEVKEIFFGNQNRVAHDGTRAVIRRKPIACRPLRQGQLLGFHEAVWEIDGEIVKGPVYSRYLIVPNDGVPRVTELTNALSLEHLETGTLEAVDWFPTHADVEARAEVQRARDSL